MASQIPLRDALLIELSDLHNGVIGELRRRLIFTPQTNAPTLEKFIAHIVIVRPRP